jgi:hypothetical protein
MAPMMVIIYIAIIFENRKMKYKTTNDFYLRSTVKNTPIIILFVYLIMYKIFLKIIIIRGK